MISNAHVLRLVALACFVCPIASAAAPATPDRIGTRVHFFASLRSYEEVDEFGTDPGHVRRIFTFTRPEGIATDALGNLYVAEDGGSVVRYPPGRGVPDRTWTRGLRAPSEVVLDSRGTMYVVDHYPRNRSVIAVFEPGRSAPAYTIVDGISAPTNMAVDPNDNLYVYNYGASEITEYAPGTVHVARRIPTCTTSLGGLAFDPAGNMYVTDLCRRNGEIAVYAPNARKPFAYVLVPTPGEIATTADGAVIAISGVRAYAFALQTLRPLGSIALRPPDYIYGLAGEPPAVP